MLVEMSKLSYHTSETGWVISWETEQKLKNHFAWSTGHDTERGPINEAWWGIHGFECHARGMINRSTDMLECTLSNTLRNCLMDPRSPSLELHKTKMNHTKPSTRGWKSLHTLWMARSTISPHWCSHIHQTVNSAYIRDLDKFCKG